ncbi:hypothetical protein [Serratia fonticola]|uniref:hypothetical protein n=1 Tax=Serratia fonticola TaxID=47917 RepID=UPI00217919B1|nr:hypothetical protein [Serratia fonticola]CAI1000898.1 Uncharacterised protein [Serratia fonticola]CAI1194821.1 Uncharacterised protein [Serratia fonticola]CAI1966891.1 Uncharacterised protein [Serratia fonticola]CAI2001478.1 Uncharacterised protein [Serratia fonticola]
MKSKMKGKLLIILFLIMLALGGGAAWQRLMQEAAFTCRAQIYRDVVTNECHKTSVFDLFLSMDNNKGYLLVSGSYSCSNAMLTPVDGVVDFTYSKEGGYYSIYPDRKDKKLADIFGVLKFADIKMKITKFNHGVYMLSLPNEILMMCTEA